MNINSYNHNLSHKSLVVLNHISLLSDFGDIFYHYELELIEKDFEWFDYMMNGLRIEGAIWIFWASKDCPNKYHLVINSSIMNFSSNVRVLKKTQLKSHYLKRMGQIIVDLIAKTFDGQVEHMDSHMIFFTRI